MDKGGNSEKLKEENLQTLDDFENNIRVNIKEDEMLVHFLSVYYLSKEDIALRKIDNFLDFISHLGVEFNENYRNHVSAREMLDSISDSIFRNIINEIALSPTIGLMIDESTDISSNQQLAIHIKYISESKSKEKCLGVFELKGCKAEDISSILIHLLKTENLLYKVEEISTDGANVMIGDHNSVVVKLKNSCLNDNLIITHCLAHR